MNASPLLQLAHVTVQRSEATLLNNVSLTIPRGRHTAILGPNGSGKTSLMRLLSRHYYPSVDQDGAQGTVKILDRDDWHILELRRRMGIVSASSDRDFVSFRSGRMTAIEVVASGWTATELSHFGPEITPTLRHDIERLLEQMSLTHLAERTVQTMSTGELRRTLIARAMIHQPDILVLDEPTTGLDIHARHHFLKTIGDMIAHRSTTLFLVTHHVEEILPAIDHVLLLDRGRIVFDGAKSEALTEERMSKLFGLPLHVQSQPGGTYEITLADSN